MAIYHMTMSNISRRKGSSAVATASYFTGVRMTDQRTGQVCDYGRKQRVHDYGVCLPEGAPESYRDPEVLMNAVELSDKASDSKPAKKIEMALPRELSFEQQRELAVRFVEEQISSHGYGCIWSIHTDREGNNPHVHIEIANRPIRKDGKWGAKFSSHYKLDADGNKIPIIDKKTGKQKTGARNALQWVREKTCHYIDDKQTLLILREQWAVYTNKALELSGSDARVDHRSYKEQGIDRMPTIHEGYAARRMESEGMISERMEINRAIREVNEARAEEAQLREIRKTYDETREGFTEVRRKLEKRLRELDRRSRAFAVQTAGRFGRIHEIGNRLAVQIASFARRVSAGIREAFQSAGADYRNAEKGDPASDNGKRRGTRRLSAALRRFLSNYTAPERKAPRSVRTRNAGTEIYRITSPSTTEAADASGRLKPTASRPRVTSVSERKAILDAARTRFNTVPIALVMHDYGLTGKIKRMKFSGTKSDVFQLKKVHHGHDGILMTKCQYVNIHGGYTGYGGGSAFDFAREYVPAYAGLDEEQAAEKFAMRYLPHLMTEYEQTTRPLPEKPAKRESFEVIAQQLREEQGRKSVHKKKQEKDRSGRER